MILCKVDFVAILRVIFLKKDTDLLKKGISVSLNRFVGMTGFEPATTRPPDVKRKTNNYLFYTILYILLKSYINLCSIFKKKDSQLHSRKSSIFFKQKSM